MKQARHPSSTEKGAYSARGRYVLYAAIGCLAALVGVLLPDLLQPEQAQAIEIPNPIKEIGNIAENALGGAANAVSAPLKEGFIWMVNTLFGGPQAEMTMALVRYLTTMPNFASGSVLALQRNMQAVAGALLACVLTLSIIRYWIGAHFEGSNMMAGFEGVVKVIFAATLIGVWPTLFTLASKFFNALSASLLSGPLKNHLADLFTEISGATLLASGLTGPIGSSVGMLMWIVIAIATTILFLGLLLMKIMVTAGTVIVFVAMPLALILWPIPETSWIAKALAKTLVVLLAIPVVWVVIFSAAAALGSDVFGASNKEGAEVAASGLDAILIKPLIAIALMYMAISIPSKLLRMAPMMGALRGGGRMSGMAIGMGTSMAARGAYGALAGRGAAAGAGSVGALSKQDKLAARELGAMSPNDRTKLYQATGVGVAAGPGSKGDAPAAAVATSRSMLGAQEATDADHGREAGRQAKAMTAGSAVNSNTPAQAWTSTAASSFGQGQYQLPGEADSKMVDQRAEQAGKLKQQWSGDNAAGKSPSSIEARQAFETLSPQAQSSVQQVAVDTRESGNHRDHLAGPAVNENPYHGDEARQAFATLGASSPSIFQEAVNSPQPSPPAADAAVASAVAPPKGETSDQVFGAQPTAPTSHGNGTSRPSSPTVAPRATKATHQTKQGG